MEKVPKERIIDFLRDVLNAIEPPEPTVGIKIGQAKGPILLEKIKGVDIDKLIEIGEAEEVVIVREASIIRREPERVERIKQLLSELISELEHDEVDRSRIKSIWSQLEKVLDKSSKILQYLRLVLELAGYLKN